MADYAIHAMPVVRHPNILVLRPMLAVAAGRLRGLMLIDMLGGIHAANFTREREAG